MKIKKIVLIASAMGVFAIGGTTAFAASYHNSLNKAQTAVSSSKVNIDENGNVIDDKGNIVITKDKLNDPANASGHITASATLMGKIDSNNLSEQDKAAFDALKNDTGKQNVIKSEASAQLNTDKDGNVIDEKGNIVITKDKLNDPANASGQITVSADSTH